MPDGFDPARAPLPGLPSYEGGRKSDALYNVGYGLHDPDGAVQASHHMINQPDHLFGVAAPDDILVHQSHAATEDGNIRCRTLRSMLPEENLLFTSAGTHILAAKEGRWLLREVLPSVQEPYDGSFL